MTAYLPFACALFTAGFALREYGAFHPDNVPVYLASTLLIYMSPYASPSPPLPFPKAPLLLTLSPTPQPNSRTSNLPHPLPHLLHRAHPRPHPPLLRPARAGGPLRRRRGPQRARRRLPRHRDHHA